MDKQNREGSGKMPAAPKTEFVNGGPFAEVSQGGFIPERGGNLRDHDGCRPNKEAIAATEHYDGDFGIQSPITGPSGLASGGSPTAGSGGPLNSINNPQPSSSAPVNGSSPGGGGVMTNLTKPRSGGVGSSGGKMPVKRPGGGRSGNRVPILGNRG